MNKLISQCVAILSIFAALQVQATTIEAGEYQIDPTHSKVGFDIDHLVISSVEGRFTQFDGKILIAPQLAQSKAEVSVEVASIDTEVKDRDDHLRSADFFDAKKYPKMLFKVKKVTGSLPNLTLVGDLTLHGITKEVSLETKYLGKVKDPWGNEMIAFVSKANISRKAFGLTWNNLAEVGPVVGDEVRISLKIQAVKKVAAK